MQSQELQLEDLQLNDNEKELAKKKYREIADKYFDVITIFDEIVNILKRISEFRKTIEDCKDSNKIIEKCMNIKKDFNSLEELVNNNNLMYFGVNQINESMIKEYIPQIKLIYYIKLSQSNFNVEDYPNSMHNIVEGLCIDSLCRPLWFLRLKYYIIIF